MHVIVLVLAMDTCDCGFEQQTQVFRRKYHKFQDVSGDENDVCSNG